MLGIVLAGHTGFASGTLKSLKHLLGALPEQCISVEYTDWLSTNMLSRMMCDALHAADSGDGVVFITDILGAAPFRSAALMSHKHSKCEVVVGISLGAMIQLFPQRGGLTASEFRDRALELTRGQATSLWHEQNRHPTLMMRSSEACNVEN
ncbi:PTS sugar transporter subunit IIA [Obesumbacterium proteus]|uniref:PTS system IIA component n=1 Tax=Obesumbacterium proteus ATCC 12841 TaxID=1354268 RepID=A0AA91ELI9_9GAMM|nr:PTS sugar transporter subunit IIA [Obesumbacterium proteus]AMO80892.1 PTS sugar transporter subunit IIA [Obesumbacterium proteus]OAT60647.1 putative PTS system IIA component [Obesumbacterium proteus ATCC 12841]